MDKNRWYKMMQIFGLPNNQHTYAELVKAYAEKHRYYHTAEHIEACLHHLDQFKSQAKNLEKIELALWFHDAIYQPYRSDNEVKSAQWLQQFLSGHLVDQAVIDEVYQLIMVTLHTGPTNVTLSDDQALMVDIDLSILGACQGVYQVYERNVRKEYRFVPYFLYRKKRQQLLQSFLDLSTIYHTEYFMGLYENSARENIARAISEL